MGADFLQLDGKRVLVFGVANRKSVAWHVSRVLVDAGAEVVYVVRNDERRDEVQPLVGEDAMRPFHETPKRAFLRAFDISCFSLVAVSNAAKDLLAPDASVVTVSIS